jgi:hypothetical protein
VFWGKIELRLLNAVEVCQISKTSNDIKVNSTELKHAIPNINDLYCITFGR